MPHDNLAALQTLTATLEARALKPPAELSGAALSLFEAIAAGNVSRAWNASHAFALADYCRLSVLYGQQMHGIESEGVIVAGKKNPRFAAMQSLSTERLRLARLLGLAVGSSDGYLAGTRGGNARMRALGASMAAAQDRDVDGYLS